MLVFFFLVSIKDVFCLHYSILMLIHRKWDNILLGEDCISSWVARRCISVSGRRADAKVVSWRMVIPKIASLDYSNP